MSPISIFFSGLLIFYELIDTIFSLSNNEGLATIRYDFPA